MTCQLTRRLVGQNTRFRFQGLLPVRRIAVLLFCALLSLVAFPGDAAGPSRRWRFGSSVTYSRGDYGTDITSDFVYIPFTAKRYFSAADMSVTVPWLWIESSGSFTFPAEDGLSSAETVRVSESDAGLGDTVLKGTYYARSPDGWMPGADLVGKLKVPTADDGDGLGTGETDVGVGAETYTWLPSRDLALFDIYYNILGDPPGRDLDNQLVWDVGLGHYAGSRWYHSLFFEHRTAAQDGDDDSMSVYYLGKYEPSRRVDVFGMLETGLSHGAPDYAVTMGLSVDQ